MFRINIRLIFPLFSRYFNLNPAYPIIVTDTSVSFFQDKYSFKKFHVEVFIIQI